MEKQNEKEGVNIEDVISKSELFLEKNKTLLIIAVVAVLVIIFGFFGLKKFYFQPRQERANAAVFAAEQWFAQGDFQKALDGDDRFEGFVSVADRYGKTKAGQRAKYCAGMCYLQLGDFNKAVNYLNSYKGSDVLTPIFAEIAAGDAALELGDNAAALRHYEVAAKMDENDITTPYALMKAGCAYLVDNNGAKAKTCFEQIKEKYPYSTEYRDADQYIALAGNL